MTDWFRFACPDCAAAFAVDGAAREALLDAGCARCGATVSAAAFRRTGAPASA